MARWCRSLLRLLSLCVTMALLLLLQASHHQQQRVHAEVVEPVARASHILVETEANCDAMYEQLLLATDLHATFAALAREHSTCPSRRKGGKLGTFGRGQMVGEFDRVVFEERMGVVHKVKTQFGWHLVLVTERYGVDELAISRKKAQS
ncbi:hypothetical protein P43SY_010051 [Pythium insidiosum]|uniref:Peptidyl-prolyl cis-trans isomerase n=1 Tax=Pythium insidiosum TaxID=114742 RepID=A0AAD5QA40_PYTIN|nr:hypothetical protein P43SY_010051 [Pythium insidiosum]